VYAQAMRRGEDEQGQIAALVDGGVSPNAGETSDATHLDTLNAP